jgi:hypothetical protein
VVDRKVVLHIYLAGQSSFRLSISRKGLKHTKDVPTCVPGDIPVLLAPVSLRVARYTCPMLPLATGSSPKVSKSSEMGAPNADCKNTASDADATYAESFPY